MAAKSTTASAPAPKPLVALPVGHSRAGDSGAVSVTGASEHEYNSGLAAMIAEELAGRGINSIVISRYEGRGYTAAMKWLAAHLKERGATIAIELHFNSASATARGHEWLHFPGSTKGTALAVAIEKQMSAAFPALPARGVKTPATGRGDAFLRLTHCPAVIGEPFFGSNGADWALAVGQKRRIAEVYADGIEAYLTASK